MLEFEEISEFSSNSSIQLISEISSNSSMQLNENLIGSECPF
jgi:hypothetical protein